MLVSISIPCYEMNGDGVMFLDLNLKNIENQTFKNIEVVISDHSLDDFIKNLCDSYVGKLNIVYIKNEIGRGSSSANMNNALKKCSGDIIKFMMQDEYLCNIDAIEKIKNVFQENESVNWLVNGCFFGAYPDLKKGAMLPCYSQDMIKAKNTIGSPSVVTIKNKDIEFFNEDLIWVMDCEYYKRVYDKFGLPYVLNDYLIYVNQHKNQVTNLIMQEIKSKEENCLIKKYTK